MEGHPGMKVLFIANGLGLGNSTRCHAVMQHLHDAGVEIHLITSGNGLWYFQDKEEVSSVIEAKSLYYSKKNGKLSIAGTVASLPAFYAILKHNSRVIRQVLEEHRPDIVISDSEYSFSQIKKMNIPLVSLNNADVVVSYYRQSKERPSSVFFHFHVVEHSDFLYNKYMPDLVISPSLDNAIPQFGKPFFRVGPIVRKGYEPTSGNTPGERATIMLSGSTFGSQVSMTRDSYPVHVDVIGRPPPENWAPRDDVIFHGKIRDTQPFLQVSDLVVVNGGFSAVSEAFYLRRPMVVVPVSRHAEQWVNAQVIEDLGVGMIAGEHEIEEKMLEALGRLDQFRRGYDRIGVIPDGARQAADILLGYGTGPAS